MERDSAQFTKQRSGSTDSSGLGGQNYNIVAAGPNGEQSVLRSFRVASS